MQSKRYYKKITISEANASDKTKPNIYIYEAKYKQANIWIKRNEFA